MIDIAFINETNEDSTNFESLIEAVFHETLRSLSINTYYEVSVVFMNNEQIQAINKQYRNIDKPTDVISFALMDTDDIIEDIEIPTLGDIFISIDKAKMQADDYGHSLQREMGFLACHGLLHLLGYDHMTKEEEDLMFQKQDEILNNLKLHRTLEEN